MTVNHLHKTVLWLFVAVVADSLVAIVLRIGSLQDLLDGDRSWTNIVALGGLATLALLLAVTLRTARDLLSLWHEATAATGRIALLEVSAMMSRAQAMARPRTVQAEFGRDVLAARQRLMDVLDRGSLTTAMQPIVDLERDRWVGVEALARFPDGRGPDLWFREATEMGLGIELELLAVKTALSRAGELPSGIGISVNASPSLILDERLNEAIHESGIALDRLTLEITEHAAVTEYDDITTALLVLRERGMCLAVDDTGAGYSSFSHVLQLRPDVIKLDRSMILDIATDPARRAFVTAVVLLALELSATITAEGVETRAQLETAAVLGIDHVQGSLLSRPETSPATWRSWEGRRWVSPIDLTPMIRHLARD
jgi:EAL domain-containing protein (putative c-di-GMP-specific phosphodiesterase class I)